MHVLGKIKARTGVCLARIIFQSVNDQGLPARRKLFYGQDLQIRPGPVLSRGQTRWPGPDNE
jgi:hypothetical protein